MICIEGIPEIASRLRGEPGLPISRTKGRSTPRVAVIGKALIVGIKVALQTMLKLPK
jgi:hypothetical protein